MGINFVTLQIIFQYNIMKPRGSFIILEAVVVFIITIQQ